MTWANVAWESTNMKREELHEGQLYWARHTSGTVKVRLIAIRELAGYKSPNTWVKPKSVTRYHCIKIGTGRDIVFKSALKFIREVSGSD